MHKIVKAIYQLP